MIKYLILHFACTLFCLSATGQNDQKSDSLFLQNELWIYHSIEDVMGISTSKVLFFSNDGQFRYISSISASAYYHNCFSGRYEYDSLNRGIKLLAEIGFVRGSADEEISIENCPKFITIVAETDSTVTANLGLDLQKDITFNCQTSNRVLILPASEKVCEVLEMGVRRDYGDTVVAISDANCEMIISILNKVEYSKKLNDGRMMKLPPQDFTIVVKGKDEYQNIFIDVWSDKLHAGTPSTTCWYHLDNYSQTLLFDLLNNYFLERSENEKN